MVEVLQCPICGNKQFEEVFNCTDYTVSQKQFHVKRCTSCELGITSPRPVNAELGKYYQSEEYISHSGKSSGGIGSIYKIARSFSLRWKKRIITKYKSGNNALDFGCGTGEFIHTLQQAGWSIAGIEPSDTARPKAEELNQIMIARNLDEIGETKYDAITAWHVLEHIPELNESFQKIKALLVKDGILFIAVPNHQSPDAEMYGNTWAAYDVPRHLWHFSKKSMNQLFEKNGLKIIKILPMKLDSYYVSLLSEKYKNNNALSIGVVVRAMLSGFRSNFIAKNKVNHSSLIYIAKIHEG